VGRWLDRALATTATAQSAMACSLRRGAFGAMLTGVALCFVAAALPKIVRQDTPIAPEMVRAARELAAMLTAGSALGWACLLCGGAVARWRQAGIAVLTAMMLCVVWLSATVLYRVAAEDILLPYQRMAVAARPDSLAGTPILFVNPTKLFGLPPRRPSMLYYGGYSPFETGEPAFPATLREVMSPGVNEADIITNGQCYADLVEPHVRHTGSLAIRILQRTGAPKSGWVLARVERTASTRGKSSQIPRMGARR
jgi:hypothetical protein